MEQHNIIRTSVSRETFEETDALIQNNRLQLENYLDQLLWWNKRVNLVSRDVPRETIWEHIRHSLIISHLDIFKNEDLIIDTGTGGGLPGIPLAITHPEKHFVLNDLVTKKCLAMKQIAQKLQLQNIGIIDGSIEELQHDDECLLISKHAFKISDIIRMSYHLTWKKMILYKGLEFEKEIKDIPQQLTINCMDLSQNSDFYQGKSIVIIDRP
ncbi:16S rRNA (guanine(527)-N(7))-methyltransferase RsmG [Fodinibius sp. Rm-B-1B1-1]|uniref:16S rRNA (guanine(527)-N(7))-methyltransferase RsmG n=1 Tax=Fodinibius alkaliphilus TaxID=3140241 RepID=UPI00315A5D41